MNIQPVNKAAEHLINSTPVLERGKKAVKAYFIKNSKGERGCVGGGGRGGGSEGSRKDWAELYGV